MALAKTMVEIGTHAGRQVTAVLTGMEEPLGTHVGNSLEVKEAIDILSGRAGGDLKKVAIYLGAHMLCAAGVTANMTEADEKLRAALDSGAGLNKFAEMIEAQGGDPRVTEDVNLLPQAPIKRVVTADHSGIVTSMNTRQLGLIALSLGAGRRTKEDVIDPSVGFIMHVRLGDRVNLGDPLAEIHARSEVEYRHAESAIRDTIKITESEPAPHPLIYAVLTREGTMLFQ